MVQHAGTILVVEDDVVNRTLLATSLREAGHAVEIAENGLQALELLQSTPFDLVLLDLLMPKMDGFQLLERMKADDTLRHIPVIVISAIEKMESVIRCIDMGATDYLPKSADPVLLHARIKASLKAKRFHDRELDYLRDFSFLTKAAADFEADSFESESLTEVAARPDALGQLARVFQQMVREVEARQQHLKQQVQDAHKDRYKFGLIIGKSQVMQHIYEQMTHAAASGANVVITGESGTGKELVAQTIHQQSKRAKKAFVPVNCGAIPENLFENEFFGHRKGAFTGAGQNKPGLLETAHGGTLFLDEIGELPPAMQVKFLRALQNGEYTAVGAQKPKQVDVRIIAATNQNFVEQREQGIIRDDFFYRLYVIAIHLPPLRDRKGDIPLLVEHFLEQYRPEETTMLSGQMMEALLHYHWPGNIRELQNTIQRYLAGEGLEFIDSHQLASQENSSRIKPGEQDLRQATERFEKSLIAGVLEQQHYHRAKAAEVLGIPLTTLYRKLKKYDI
ncbi:MAG: sigma-54-dependent Fis family transcriptional regulator [bacterium]|nr:sigma-54-dependent Fis family transcriptional regulator [bacterium]